MNTEEDVSIQENFLAEKEFIELRDTITQGHFPWHYSPDIILDDEEPSPGLFYQLVYQGDTAITSFYESHFLPILKRLNSATLFRIRVNLNFKLSEPYYSSFHRDVEHFDISQWTASILYINTNNGYTELESGQKIESVANRLVSFPLNIKHRTVTQTDQKIRLLINFNYLKYSSNLTNPKDMI